MMSESLKGLAAETSNGKDDDSCDENKGDTRKKTPDRITSSTLSKRKAIHKAYTITTGKTLNNKPSDKVASSRGNASIKTTCISIHNEKSIPANEKENRTTADTVTVLTQRIKHRDPLSPRTRLKQGHPVKLTRAGNKHPNQDVVPVERTFTNLPISRSSYIKQNIKRENPSITHEEVNICDDIERLQNLNSLQSTNPADHDVDSCVQYKLNFNCANSQNTNTEDSTYSNSHSIGKVDLNQNDLKEHKLPLNANLQTSSVIVSGCNQEPSNVSLQSNESADNIKTAKQGVNSASKLRSTTKSINEVANPCAAKPNASFKKAAISVMRKQGMDTKHVTGTTNTTLPKSPSRTVSRNSQSGRMPIKDAMKLDLKSAKTFNNADCVKRVRAVEGISRSRSNTPEESSISSETSVNPRSPLNSRLTSKTNQLKLARTTDNQPMSKSNVRSVTKISKENYTKGENKLSRSRSNTPGSSSTSSEKCRSPEPTDFKENLSQLPKTVSNKTSHYSLNKASTQHVSNKRSMSVSNKTTQDVSINTSHHVSIKTTKSVSNKTVDPVSNKTTPSVSNKTSHPVSNKTSHHVSNKTSHHMKDTVKVVSNIASNRQMARSRSNTPPTSSESSMSPRSPGRQRHCVKQIENTKSKLPTERKSITKPNANMKKEPAILKGTISDKQQRSNVSYMTTRDTKSRSRSTTPAESSKSSDSGCSDRPPIPTGNRFKTCTVKVISKLVKENRTEPQRTTTAKRLRSNTTLKSEQLKTKTRLPSSVGNIKSDTSVRQNTKTTPKTKSDMSNTCTRSSMIRSRSTTPSKESIVNQAKRPPSVSNYKNSRSRSSTPGSGIAINDTTKIDTQSNCNENVVVKRKVIKNSINNENKNNQNVHTKVSSSRVTREIQHTARTSKSAERECVTRESQTKSASQSPVRNVRSRSTTPGSVSISPDRNFPKTKDSSNYVKKNKSSIRTSDKTKYAQIYTGHKINTTSTRSCNVDKSLQKQSSSTSKRTATPQTTFRIDFKSSLPLNGNIEKRTINKWKVYSVQKSGNTTKQGNDTSNNKGNTKLHTSFDLLKRENKLSTDNKSKSRRVIPNDKKKNISNDSKENCNKTTIQSKPDNNSVSKSVVKCDGPNSHANHIAAETSSTSLSTLNESCQHTAMIMCENNSTAAREHACNAPDYICSLSISTQSNPGEYISGDNVLTSSAEYTPNEESSLITSTVIVTGNECIRDAVCSNKIRDLNNRENITENSIAQRESISDPNSEVTNDCLSVISETAYFRGETYKQSVPREECNERILCSGNKHLNILNGQSELPNGATFIDANKETRSDKCCTADCSNCAHQHKTAVCVNCGVFNSSVSSFGDESETLLAQSMETMGENRTYSNCEICRKEIHESDTSEECSHAIFCQTICDKHVDVFKHTDNKFRLCACIGANSPESMEILDCGDVGDVLCFKCQSDKKSELLTRDKHSYDEMVSKKMPIECRNIGRVLNPGDLENDNGICRNASFATGAEQKCSSLNKRHDTTIVSNPGASVRNDSLCATSDVLTQADREQYSECKTHISRNKHSDQTCFLQENISECGNYSEQVKCFDSTEGENVCEFVSQDTCEVSCTLSTEEHCEVINQEYDTALFLDNTDMPGNCAGYEPTRRASDISMMQSLGRRDTQENNAGYKSPRRASDTNLVISKRGKFGIDSDDGHCSQITNDQSDIITIPKSGDRYDTADTFPSECNVIESDRNTNSNICSETDDTCIKMKVVETQLLTSEISGGTSEHNIDTGSLMNLQQGNSNINCEHSLLQDTDMSNELNLTYAPISSPKHCPNQTKDTTSISTDNNHVARDSTCQSHVLTSTEYPSSSNCNNNITTTQRLDDQVIPDISRDENGTCNDENDLLYGRPTNENSALDQLYRSKTDGDIRSRRLINDVSETEEIFCDNEFTCCTMMNPVSCLHQTDSVEGKYSHEYDLKTNKGSSVASQKSCFENGHDYNSTPDKPNSDLHSSKCCETCHSNSIKDMEFTSKSTHENKIQHTCTHCSVRFHVDCDRFAEHDFGVDHIAVCQECALRVNLLQNNSIKTPHDAVGNKVHCEEQRSCTNLENELFSGIMPCNGSKKEITKIINPSKASKSGDINTLSLAFDEGRDRNPAVPLSRDCTVSVVRHADKFEDLDLKPAVDFSSKESLEIYNRDGYQDEYSDKMSRLSALKITTPKSSCNEVFSENSIQPSDFIERYGEQKKSLSHEKHLTSFDDRDMCKTRLLPGNNLDNLENNRDVDINSEIELNNLQHFDSTENKETVFGLQCDETHCSCCSGYATIDDSTGDNANCVCLTSNKCNNCLEKLHEQEHSKLELAYGTSVSEEKLCDNTQDIFIQAHSQKDADNRHLKCDHLQDNFITDLSQPFVELPSEKQSQQLGEFTAPVNDTVKSECSVPDKYHCEISSGQDDQTFVDNSECVTKHIESTEDNLRCNSESKNQKIFTEVIVNKRENVKSNGNDQRSSIISSESCISDLSERFVDAEEELTNAITVQNLQSDGLQDINYPENSVPENNSSTESQTTSNRGTDAETSAEENFQDAVEQLNDDYLTSICVKNTSNKLSDDHEETLSQTSLCSSSCSECTGTSFDNLSEWEDFDDDLEEIVNYDKAMDQSGGDQNTIVVKETPIGNSKPACTRVRTAVFRTKTVLKDNAYLQAAASSGRIVRCSQIQANLLRSKDIKNEPEQQVIRGTIFKTGNGKQFQTNSVENIRSKGNNGENSKLQNGRNATNTDASNREDISTPKDIAQSDTDTEQQCNDQGISTTKNQLTDINTNTSSVHTKHTHMRHVRSVRQSNTEGTLVYRENHSMVNSKIETALIKRTQRRRRRQVERQFEHLQQSESFNKSEGSTQEVHITTDTSCHINISRDNNFIECSESQHSTHSTTACVQTDKPIPVNKTVSGFETELQDSKIISNLNDSNTDTLAYNETSMVQEDDVCFVQKEGISEFTGDNKVVVDLDISRDELTSRIDDNRNTDNDTKPRSVFMVNDNMDNVEKSDMLCIKDTSECLENMVSENTGPVSTIEVMHTQSHGLLPSIVQIEINDNSVVAANDKPLAKPDIEFEDIEFIDADGDSQEGKDDVNEEDTNNANTPSPNASFTLTYDADGENADVLNFEVTTHDQLNSTISSKEIKTENMTNLSIEGTCQEKVSDCVKNDEIKSTIHHDQERSVCQDISVKTIIENMSTTEQFMLETVEPIPTDTPEEASNVEERTITFECKSVNDDQIEGEIQTEICEESNISVARALALEKQKMQAASDSTNKQEFAISKRCTRRATIQSCTSIHGTPEADNKAPEVKEPTPNISLKKSKSFKHERTETKAETTNDDEPDKDALQNKKVSDICMSFMSKTKTAVQRSKQKDTPAESPRPGRKLMKWVNDNGKWLRKPIDDDDDQSLKMPTVSITRRRSPETYNRQNDNTDICEHKSEKEVTKHEPELRDNSNNNSNVIELLPDSDVSKHSSEDCQYNDKLDEQLPLNAEDPNSLIVNTVKDTYKEEVTISNTSKDLQYKVHIETDTQGNIHRGDNNEIPIRVKHVTIDKVIPVLVPESTGADANKQPDTKHNDGSIDEPKIPIGVKQQKDNLELIDLKNSETNVKVTESKQSAAICDTKDDVDIQLTSMNITDEVKVVGTALDDTNGGVEKHLKRQELLLGLLNSYYRRKPKRMPKKMETDTQQAYATDSSKCDIRNRYTYTSMNVSQDESHICNAEIESNDADESDIPKPIPKLKAVKIQSEIFESKPTPGNNNSNYINYSDQSISERSKTLSIRRSKTFAGWKNFENRESISHTPEIDVETGGVIDSSEHSTRKDSNNSHLSDTGAVKKKLKSPDKTSRRHKLLSEIAEVEENKEDLTYNNNSNQQHHFQQHQQRDRHRGQTPLTRGNKRRSLSLPTGTLAFGDTRIVYKDGHFTFETMADPELDLSPDRQTGSRGSSSNVSIRDTSTREYSGEVINGQKSYSREVNEMHNKPLMRRQYGKTVLSNSESCEDVFYNEDESLDLTTNKCYNSHQSEFSNMGPSQRDVFNDSSSSRTSINSQGSSISDRMEISTDNESCSESQKLSSSSLPEVKDDTVRRVMQRAKRTSSFRQAQETGALRLSGIEEDRIHNSLRSRPDSVDESGTSDGNKSPSVQSQNSSTFIKKMMAKRKSLNENLSLPSFTKQTDSAKDFFSKKMTLKGLFKKNKSDPSMIISSPMKMEHPSTPPIAAFSHDDDIDSVDTPPSSPFASREFRRRHTSADIYAAKHLPDSETDSNCPTPTQERSAIIRNSFSISTPSTPVHDSTLNALTNLRSSGASTSSFRDEDAMSITSASSVSSSIHSPSPHEQPNKPKTPKPVGASPRRNPSYGSQLSRLGSQSSSYRTSHNSVTSLETDMNLDNMRCECVQTKRRTQSLSRRRKKSIEGSSDSLKMCQYCKLMEYHDGGGGFGARSVDRCRKQSDTNKDKVNADDCSTKVRKDSTGLSNGDRLGIMSQADVASSNSNDSGIQRDASLNSSSESIKASAEGSVRLRRNQSLSPRPDRPKSEISVRWADADSGDYDIPDTPVKMRNQNGRDRPRPKSDLEDNIQLFDQLFEEVLEEFESEGSSFLSDRMKAFGSEINLQPYCSLRNIYEMRRRDLDKQKNRRMSTPHPIKSRLQRSPRKLNKHLPLVRSNSMPECLEKLHKRRKMHHLLDFHMDSHMSRQLDNDDCLSDDSDLSFDQASLQEKSLSVRSSTSQLTNDEDDENLTYAEALWDHITMDPEELGFRAQDVIEVLDMSDKDWWFGIIEEREGWFPAAFVRIRVNQDQFDEDDVDTTLLDNLTASPKLRRISMFNKNQARSNVVNEIISAEREYVKHLKDVVEGYIQHARKRIEMFPEERIQLIFGNLETIYSFACKFVSQLEKCIDVCPHLSEIGQCFLDNERGFEIYSDYCNNHPSACEELKELCKDSKYKHFFEACRLLQELVEIPLEGFLLTPVQKICKYPLQLAELLKYTPPDHPDYEMVRDALSAMRKIATLINERKRKMESIEKIAAWQNSVVDWAGPDLLESSSELIFSGELNKINTAGWSQERYFFLFDHQLIYCKKDLLKRHVFSYKGRIDLDHCDIHDLDDGKDVQYNVTVKHGWKFHETRLDKWYLVYAKTAAVKERWLKAIQDQRQRVLEDQENDFCVPDHWKQTVLNKVRSQSNFKEKQSSGRTLQGQLSLSHKDYKDFTYSTLPRHRVSAQKHDKKKGWFKFVGGKKSKR